MASLVKRPNGHFWIQYKAHTGRRQTIRLGKIPREFAEETKLRIERLIVCCKFGAPPDPVTIAWMDQIGRQLRDRLVELELIKQSGYVTLGQLISDFKSSLDVKPSTYCNINRACISLSSFFGESILLGDLTEASAKEFRSWLSKSGGDKGGPLAKTTVSRRCRRAKQVFQYAIEKRWLARSPFAVLKGGNEVNRDRDFFVDIKLICKVLEETPSISMQAIIILVRFGALRCPSEVLPMNWSQVNWDKGTILIHSPKTAHHDDKGYRTIPLFPEIREVLEVLWDEAKQNEPLLFPGKQVTGTAITNELRKACWSAGHALWPKPWQNMRATRVTELMQLYPVNVVANWLGHSPNVALKHYAQIVKEHRAEEICHGESVLHSVFSPRKTRSSCDLNGDNVVSSIYTAETEIRPKS